MTLLKSFNPATNDIVGEKEITPLNEIPQMVLKSKKAQEGWKKLSVRERGDFLIKAYEELSERKEEFAKLIHSEMGKTLDEAQKEVFHYCNTMKDLVKDVEDSLRPSENKMGDLVTTTYRDPLGVCASITPWNFPLGMPHNLMMPSLLAGNTVLFKPSEEVFITGSLYAELLNKYLPDNVLQLVIGKGDVGEALVKSDVQLITFTGSQGTGSKILETAGRDIKRVILEMGGKDPLIVLKSCNIKETAKYAAMNSTRNCGQVCVSTEQIFVEEEIFEEFKKELLEVIKTVKIGPMVHYKQKKHVLEQVSKAIESGATLEYGSLEDDKSNFLSPILVSNANMSMSLLKDETFGPVATLVKVKSGEEAVELTNQTPYALGASIFGNEEEAAKLSRNLNAAMVGINRNVHGVKGSPWVGAGRSGYGLHGSSEGHRQFTQIRIVTKKVKSL